MKQIYLDLVDGFHIKVKPIAWGTWIVGYTVRPCVRVTVQETACGYREGETIQCFERNLFVVAGHSKVSGKIDARVPDLSFLGEKPK